MPRRRHPSKHVEKALRHAEAHGWRIENLEPRAHGWGTMYCPHDDARCRCGVFCMKVVWGTPAVPENLARQIRRVVDGCVHTRPDRRDGMT